MNEQIKQRLVGAVVLVSLAVIFVPMLLDGGDNSSMPRFGSNIPPQPEFDFEPLEIPLQPLAAAAERPRVIDQPEKVESQPAQTPPPPAAVAKPPAAKVSVSKPETVTAKPDNEIAEAAKAPASGEPVAWVVQVGSFSQSDNALALRDKLRQNGFTAFVEKYRDAGKSSYRVRVGPELKRDTAEQQLQRLEAKLKLKGIIMGHP